MKLNRDLRLNVKQPRRSRSLLNCSPDRRFGSDKRRIEDTEKIEELDDEHEEEETGHENKNQDDDTVVDSYSGFQLKSFDDAENQFGEIEYLDCEGDASSNFRLSNK